MYTNEPLRVRIWNEGIHESSQPEMAVSYPDGIHGAIAAGLREWLPDDTIITTSLLSDFEHGLTEVELDTTDVLLWWGHKAHDQVDDLIVDRVHKRVLAGMGLLVLHSAHFSKIFIKLMGTTCSLKWRNEGEREVIFNVNPTHPINHGITEAIVISAHEMYGEYFDIPQPDDLLFISSFAGGEVFRSGVTFTRGRGRIFYFSPGDEAYPVYHHPTIRRILANAVNWAQPDNTCRVLPAISNPTRNWFMTNGGFHDTR